MTSRAGQLSRELRALSGPLRALLVRRLPEIVVGAAAGLTVLGALVLLGAARDDAAIDGHLGRATAQVLEGSTATRTLVRFPGLDGQVHTPEHGVYYPRGLHAGELVRVEYDVTDPDKVRVAGRDWTQGLAPVLGGIAVLWLVALPLASWLRTRRRRPVIAAAAEPRPLADRRTPPFP